MNNINIISKYYNAAAKMFLNIFIFLFLVNICLFMVFKINTYFSDVKNNNPVIDKYGISPLKGMYPTLSEKDIINLLSETWSRPFIFEPFTLFKERPYKGHYVNVDNNGFRLTKNQGPWPPSLDNLNIFVFGGSTTFGYGVPDDKTITSFLQEYLSDRLKQDVRVYNFGRGNYYSLQERVLFENLLISGFIPDLAIFIDGLNDFYFIDGNPAHMDLFEQMNFSSREGTVVFKTLVKLIYELPMVRFANHLKDLFREFLKQTNHPEIYDNVNGKILIDKSKITSVINRYLENKKIIEVIAKKYNTKSVFVWQPVPGFKYDLKYHLFIGDYLKKLNYMHNGYLYMEELVKNKSLGNNFLWTADMQESFKKPLYIDNHHYSIEMSEIFASTIGQLLLDRNLLTAN